MMSSGCASVVSFGGVGGLILVLAVATAVWLLNKRLTKKQ